MDKNHFKMLTFNNTKELNKIYKGEKVHTFKTKKNKHIMRMHIVLKNCSHENCLIQNQNKQQT